MIKNNKGFMLVEVVITSTVIITAMIGLYTAFNKLYKNYETKNNYYNIDAAYATNEMIDSIFDKDINSFLNNVFYYEDFKYLIKDGECNTEILTETEEVPDNIDVDICNGIKDAYQVKNMILIEFDKTSLLNFKEKELNNISYTFQDYIDYVIGYYGLSNNEEYDYLFLTEIIDGDKYYYSNMRVR